jgi:hypothetical protein
MAEDVLYYMVSPEGTGILTPEDVAKGEEMAVTQTFSMDMIDTMRARAQAYGYTLVAVPYAEVPEPTTEVKLPVAPKADVPPTVQAMQLPKGPQTVAELQAKLEEAQAEFDLAKAEGEAPPQSYP